MKSSSSTKFLSKPVINHSNRLRRRPFLLFDKLPPRGFKRLKPKTEDHTTSTLSAKYKLGDGFSKDEAKPNGLVQLGLRPTTKRKALQVESKVGALDLTQSSFRSSPKKDHTLKHKTTTKKKKRAYDNSFLPDPKRTERQRKRQKHLKKKDSPLEDKEMLPPAPVPKPKIILTSYILGDHSNVAEKVQRAVVDTTLGHQHRQTQKKGEDALGEATGIPPEEDYEDDNTGAEVSDTREPSVELGEFPVNELPGHSAVNHQQKRHHQQESTQEQQQDPVEVLSKEAVEKPVEESAVAVEPVKVSPKELIEQASERPMEEPIQSPLNEQEKETNQVGEDDPKSVTITIKQSASVSASAKLNVAGPTTEEGDENPNPTQKIAASTKLAPTTTPGETHYQSQSQRSQHQGRDQDQNQDAPHREEQETSPGSGWETYISETDIHHTPTPPRPLLNSRAKSAVPVTSRESGRRGLKRSSSAI